MVGQIARDISHLRDPVWEGHKIPIGEVFLGVDRTVVETGGFRKESCPATKRIGLEHVFLFILPLLFSSSDFFSWDPLHGSSTWSMVDLFPLGNLKQRIRFGK